MHEKNDARLLKFFAVFYHQRLSVLHNYFDRPTKNYFQIYI